MDKLLNRLYFIVIPVLLVVTGVVLAYTLSNNQRLTAQNEQLVAIGQQLKAQSTATHKDVEDVKSTLICIGNFFSIPNRTGVVIDSYAPCKITDTNGKTTTLSASTSNQQNIGLAPVTLFPTQSSAHIDQPSSSPNSIATTPVMQPVISQPPQAMTGPLANLDGTLRKLPVIGAAIINSRGIHE